MDLLNEVKDLLKRYGVNPRKKLGQSFCINSYLLKRMVEYANVGSSDRVLDIGAGFGFLTSILSDVAERVVAIELDHRLANALRDILSRKNVTIIEEDVLKAHLPNFNKIVSNPPYPISSQLICKLLEWPFEEGVLTFQREFVMKLVAPNVSREYGRLAVMTSYGADLEVLERVPRDHFYPPPQIESTVVRIKPRKKTFKVLNEAFFTDLVKMLFTQKNRKVKHALIAFLGKRFGVRKKEARRLTQGIPYLEPKVYHLTPEEFGSLSNELYTRFESGKT